MGEPIPYRRPPEWHLAIVQKSLIAHKSRLSPEQMVILRITIKQVPIATWNCDLLWPAATSNSGDLRSPIGSSMTENHNEMLPITAAKFCECLRDILFFTRTTKPGVIPVKIAMMIPLHRYLG